MAVSSSPHKGMSPAAKAKRKKGMLITGIILLSLWLIGSSLFAWLMSAASSNSAGEPVSFGQAFGTGAFLGGLFFVLGVIFLVIGIVGELNARRFNTRDWAASKSLTAAIQNLLTVPRADAYAVDGAMTRVSDAALVEVDRHFDQDTEGQVLTTINTRTESFGTTHSISSGTSYHNANGGMGLGSGPQSQHYGSSTGFTNTSSATTGTEHSVLSQTTRANLMGDALFSVFETADANGRRDTVRAISLSRPAAEGIIRDLVGSVCHQVGGPDTHAGGAVWVWVEHLVQQFAPTDISYVTDRLKAIHARPVDQRESVAIDGIAMGRGAVLVTSLSIDGAEPLQTYPVQFPEMFAQAINGATQRRLAPAQAGAIEAAS